jgi:hypothetical protein
MIAEGYLLVAVEKISYILEAGWNTSLAEKSWK